MRTYRLYQIGMVSNIPYCTYVTETQAADFTSAETLLLAGMPDNNIEYLILVVK
jgi:hypothetical protein